MTSVVDNRGWATSQFTHSASISIRRSASPATAGRTVTADNASDLLSTMLR